jgi:hypothetical protein
MIPNQLVCYQFVNSVSTIQPNVLIMGGTRELEWKHDLLRLRIQRLIPPFQFR